MLDLVLPYVTGSLGLLVIYVCAIMIWDAVQTSRTNVRERQLAERHVLRRASVQALQARQALRQR